MPEELKIEVVPEDRVDGVLKETYRDAEAARDFFERQIGEREAALARFAEEANGSPELVHAIRERPIEMLHERGLLGPPTTSAFERSIRFSISGGRGRSAGGSAGGSRERLSSGCA